MGRHNHSQELWLCLFLMQSTVGRARGRMFCSDFRYNGMRIPNLNIVTFLKTYLLFFMQKNVFFTKKYKY